jgi:hypothetical protein
MSTLGGESPYMYEYGTTELSGENNQTGRASWSTILTEPLLTDNTAVTTFNFTKGSDEWDPIPALIDADPNTSVVNPESSDMKIFSAGSTVYLANVKAPSVVTVYNLNGVVVKSIEINADTHFDLSQGIWVINIISQKTQKSVKVAVF